jgi:methionyl-tRNA formyltransferase
VKLKVILLLDSLVVSAWVFEAIAQTLKENNAEVVLAIVNQNPKSSGKKSPLLYRIYRGLDRKLFLKEPDAFAKKDLRSLEGWNIPILEINPIQKKYSDYFQKEDIEKIRTYQPDIIIRFGFRILRGEILQAAKLGVWSFHHGDNQFYKGGPPAFWEVMWKQETTGVILQRLSERLDDGQVLYKSYSQTDPLSVQRNANKIFWLSSFIIPRVIRQIKVKGIEEWEKSIQKLQPSKELSVPLLTPPTFWKMAGLWSKLLYRNFVRKIAEGRKKPYWELLAAKNNADNLLNPSSVAFQTIKPPKDRLSKGSFWADPFPIEKNNKTWVFFEDFDAKNNKGKIAVAEWDGKDLSESTIILEEEWHLSYPFTWEENNEFYLIPESGEANKTFIYKALDFPFQWQKVGVLMEGEVYDPTLIKVEGKYWLFVNQRPHKGTSAFVELYAYHSPSLLEPIWTPHTLNPIVSDVRSSRPAGRIFKKNGKLYRPSQDSGLRYGHRVKIQEILKLTTDEYLEETADIIEPDSFQGMLGTHTFNFTDQWIFSDAYYRR